MVASSRAVTCGAPDGFLVNSFRSLKKGLWSLLDKFSLFSFEEPADDRTDHHAPIIIQSLLQETTTIIIREITKQGKYILSFDELKASIQKTRSNLDLPIIVDPKDFDIILEYILEKKLAILRTNGDFVVVKFTSTESKCPSPITDGEFNRVFLQMTKEKLQARIQAIGDDIKRCRVAAINLYGKYKNQSSAERSLAIFEYRRVKALETMRNRYAASLFNIDSILDRLDDAKVNAILLESYRSGRSALIEAHKGIDLTEVEELREELASMMEFGEEIGISLTSPALDQFDNDEIEELDLELAALTNDSQLEPFKEKVEARDSIAQSTGERAEELNHKALLTAEEA